MRKEAFCTPFSQNGGKGSSTSTYFPSVFESFMGGMCDF
jgi:hypothetical protein